MFLKTNNFNNNSAKLFNFFNPVSRLCNSKFENIDIKAAQTSTN